MLLQDLVRRAAQRAPDALAVWGPDGELSYGQLGALADRIAGVLVGLGVEPGDRVGLFHEKSTKVVAAMQAVLRVGAAYVPLDPTSAIARVALCLRDCGCKAVVTGRRQAASLRAAGVRLPCLLIDVEEPAAPTADEPATRTLHDLASSLPASPVEVERREDDLAYILYTSGSTGTPKGVCLSHRNALAYVQWAVDALGIDARDRLANHAPFHFDLSVFDLYAAFWAGASVHLIPELASYAPRKLVELMHSRAISIWYCVPSVLTLMMRDGGLLEREQIAPHTVIFAGEVFPIASLRRLQRAFPRVRLYNFYGPTETNVCTAYAVPALNDGDAREIPIGSASSGDHVYAVRSDGQPAGAGEEGELWVEGPSVMLGYWGKPPQDARPYRTGDLVRVEAGGCFRYVGRVDNQVKVRGHRIELGEIETALRSAPEIEDAAVVVGGSGVEARLVAFVVAAASEAHPSLVRVKRICAERLPRYMIVDALHAVPALPLTPNGKADRKLLRAWAESPPPRSSVDRVSPARDS